VNTAFREANRGVTATDIAASRDADIATEAGKGIICRARAVSASGMGRLFESNELASAEMKPHCVLKVWRLNTSLLNSGAVVGAMATI